MTSNLRAHRFEVVHDIDEFKAVLKNYLCVSDECRQHNEAIPSFSAPHVEHEGPAPKRCNIQNSQNQLRTSDISTTKGVTIKNSTDLERAPGARSKSVEFLIVTLLIVEILVCRFCLISPRCYTFREPDPVVLMRVLRMRPNVLSAMCR